jgi:hypothetical protein
MFVGHFFTPRSGMGSTALCAVEAIFCCPTENSRQQEEEPEVGKLRRRIFHVVRENVRVAGAEATRHGDSPVGGGRAG